MEPQHEKCDGGGDELTVKWLPGHGPDGPAAAATLKATEDYDLAFFQDFSNGGGIFEKWAWENLLRGNYDTVKYQTEDGLDFYTPDDTYYEIKGCHRRVKNGHQDGATRNGAVLFTREQHNYILDHLAGQVYYVVVVLDSDCHPVKLWICQPGIFNLDFPGRRKAIYHTRLKDYLAGPAPVVVK